MIIFPLILRTIFTFRVLSTGGEAEIKTVLMSKQASVAYLLLFVWHTACRWKHHWL